jgi:hypothetical protein
MAILSSRNTKNVTRIFGPVDADETLEAISTLASEPTATLLARVQALVNMYPLSHNLRLMGIAALKERGLTEHALSLIQDSLVLYPESPMLLDRYLALKDELPAAVAIVLTARAQSIRGSVFRVVKE